MAEQTRLGGTVQQLVEVIFEVCSIQGFGVVISTSGQVIFEPFLRRNLVVFRCGDNGEEDLSVWNAMS